MRKCFADDSKICDCQPTAGRVCEGVMALRKDAERYHWLKSKGFAFAENVRVGSVTTAGFDEVIDAQKQGAAGLASALLR